MADYYTEDTEYRKTLISGILRMYKGKYARFDLENKTTSELEEIYDGAE